MQKVIFLLLVLIFMLVKEQAHAYSNVYSVKNTVQSFCFSPNGLSLYLASQDNAIRKMDEIHHNHIQAVACDPMAHSGYSGDDSDAMLAGCHLSNKQGSLQVLYGKVYFVNGLALRMVDEQEGIMKTILEDDISSMYVNDYEEIIYASGNSIKKLSDGFVQVLAGGSECIGDQDGLFMKESCVSPTHVVQDERSEGVIYFYDEKLKVIRKIKDEIVTTVPGTSGFSIFDVKHGMVYCSNGKLIKKIQHDGTFQILNGIPTKSTISMLKISPEWSEDEVYFISQNGDLQKINYLGKLETIISKSVFKPKFYRTRTILQQFEYKGNNNTCFYYCNGTTNGTVNGNSSNFGNNTFGNNTFGNNTFGNNTNGNETKPNNDRIDYYPTPILQSQVSEDGSGVRFVITFGKSAAYTHRLFYVQDSKYDTKLCKNTYLERAIPMTRLESSDITLTQNYSTNYIPLANLINNTSVDKKLTADYLQLTINLALEYIDNEGEFNGGFCRAYIYKTSQVINVFYSTNIISSLSVNKLLDYSYNIYPQLVTTDSNSGAGSLIVELMLETSNLSLIQFTFQNSTNPNSNFIINNVEYQFQSKSFKYWKISMKTASKAFDFTGTSLFYSKFESTRGYIFNDYIPLVINYQIAIPPEEKNTTVKYSLSLSGNDLVPKSSFALGDSIFVRMTAQFSYGTYKLRAKSAVLCCMKEFSPAPIYDPSKNLFGCSTYDSNTMDVWKSLYSGFVSNSQMEIVEFPSPESTHIFNFKLKYDYFPVRSSSYTAACYIQTTGGLKEPNSREIHSESYPETEVHPLSVIIPESTQPKPITSTKTVSSVNSLHSFNLMMVLLSLLIGLFIIY
ncbi:predicted protein [Naegleria gruberi]|uniref:Predicted protein n=1 Tax=Naegleria gruberi TaxID=5762 RepID=D2VMH3_NAEGR|nr:uncharacterized protein NAEGRDRAFT_80539 [Naegleria gruberi]EFC41992.1 predicted protein [Naegleria gruberi]|eukprot:XP_002674736.1 predicted protein [Naegleria gruberi strain NEG-M]